MYGKRRRTSRVSTKRSCTSCKLGSDLISNVTRNITVNTNIHSKPYTIYSKSVPTIKPCTQDYKNIVYINNDVHDVNENTSDTICSSESSISSERSISYPVSENENIIDIFETNNWKNDLGAWAVKHQISYTALTSLLQIFKQHPMSSFHINIEDIHYRNINNDSDNNKNPLSILCSNLNEKEDSQYSKNLVEIEQVNSGSKDNSNDPLAVPEQNSENFQCFVTQKLMDLENKLNQIENNMNTYQKAILQKLSILDSKENKKNNVFDNLPLKDEKDLQIMETKLKNDAAFRNQMFKQLRWLMSEDLRTSCVRLMRAILSNELAVKYSWYGMKKKQIFSQLEICKVIMHVIRKSHVDATDEKIASPIKKWLVNATGRMMNGNQKEMN